MKQLAAIIIPALLMIFVIRYGLNDFLNAVGIEETDYVCVGGQTLNGDVEPVEFGMRLHEYAWFMWWADDGAVWIERPNGSMAYYESVEDLGPQILFQNYGGELGGLFSRLTGNIKIAVTNSNLLEGKCETLER